MNQQSFPQLLISAVTVITVFSIMLYYSIWLAAVVVLGVVCMVLVVRRSAAAPPNILYASSRRWAVPRATLRK